VGGKQRTIKGRLSSVLTNADWSELTNTKVELLEHFGDIFDKKEVALIKQ